MDDEWHDLAVRVAALEKAMQRELRADAMQDLLNWLIKDQVNDLGRTRGKLRAFEALAAAVIAVAPDKAALAAALAAELDRAEEDVRRMPLTDVARGAARVALQDAGATLLYAIDPEAFTPPPAAPERPRWELPERPRRR